MFFLFHLESHVRCETYSVGSRICGWEAFLIYTLSLSTNYISCTFPVWFSTFEIEIAHLETCRTHVFCVITGKVQRQHGITPRALVKALPWRAIGLTGRQCCSASQRRWIPWSDLRCRSRQGIVMPIPSITIPMEDRDVLSRTAVYLVLVSLHNKNNHEVCFFCFWTYWGGVVL